MTDRDFDLHMKRICKGDRNSLREIYDAYLAYIYSIAMGLLKNKEDAEDVTSEFFIRLWNTSEKYKGGRGHKAYITTIARNMCLDLLRKKRRETLTDFYDEEESAKNGGFEDNSSRFEDQVAVQVSLKEALKILNENERQIINMKFAGDLTFKEIAGVLGVPMGTVTWRYNEAMKKLRGCGYE